MPVIALRAGGPPHPAARLSRASFRPTCSRRRDGGVTLIELSVAITILALVMVSLFVTFRTGVKAYDIGQQHARDGQGKRFASARFSDDLRNVFYRSENQYNVTRRQKEAVRDESSRRVTQARAAGGARGDSADAASEEELPPKLDLGFRATGGSGSVSPDAPGATAITFVSLQHDKHVDERLPWGLARVHYYVADGALFRAVEDATAPPEDEDGNVLEKPNPPKAEKIADHCKSVSFKFGYWFEDSWRVAGDWDSDQNRHRNPPTEDELRKQEEAGAANGRIGRGGARLARGGRQRDGEANQAAQQAPKIPDDTPAWVEATFVFFDARNPEKEFPLKLTVAVPPGQETYLPPDPAQDGNNGRRRPRRTSQSAASSARP